MRRIYVMDPKRKKIVQDALSQMRQTEESLGPEMMTRIKMLARDFNPDHLASLGIEPAQIMPEYHDDGKEPVDRQKTLLIVMKFLQLKEHSKNVQTQVRTFLSDLPKI